MIRYPWSTGSRSCRPASRPTDPPNRAATAISLPPHCHGSDACALLPLPPPFIRGGMAVQRGSRRPAGSLGAWLRRPAGSTRAVEQGAVSARYSAICQTL